MFTKDDSLPDYKVHWLDKSRGKKGSNKIFTYGAKSDLAVAAFNLLYPHLEIDNVEKLSAAK